MVSEFILVKFDGPIKPLSTNI